MSETKHRTPTETLISVMEDLGESEATSLIVIYHNAAGELCWSRSQPMQRSVLIGMLECVKHDMLDDWVKGKE